MVQSFSDLNYECIAIGSLPHKEIEKAMEIVKSNFRIPFWPQLTNLNEDIISQFSENMSSFFDDYEKPYEQIIDKYKISENKAHSFEKFIELIKNEKPKYAKGQITGPVTFLGEIGFENEKSFCKDEKYIEIITRLLTLKALWQIKKIKSANENTVPIIFIDEPSLNKVGQSKFLQITKEKTIDIIKYVSDEIKKNCALSGFHCCDKCDWTIPFEAGVDIVNFDAYRYAKEFSEYYSDVEKFLQKGGKIVWGIVPTFDHNVLEKTSLEDLIDVFENAVMYLTKKGINEKIILENSLFATTCGVGFLNEALAEKAMRLVRQLSERYYGV